MGNPMDDPLWSVAIYIVIAVGAFVFLLGFLGCCGACTNNQCMIFLVSGAMTSPPQEGLCYIMVVQAHTHTELRFVTKSFIHKL